MDEKLHANIDSGASKSDVGSKRMHRDVKELREIIGFPQRLCETIDSGD